jgi:demethylmenaquinone methyltransferase/2-methoxy-6-polyprenyl-1,4-benzoquinol methylase
VRAASVGPGDRILDCATGTGDLAFRFAERVGPGGEVVGCDFNESMLERARRKADERSRDDAAPVRFVQEDVLEMSFDDDVFDAASIAFGIRNVDEPVRGLREMARVVRPRGEVLVLEFGRPEGLFGDVYETYKSTLLPRIGGAVTGNPDAYRYLHESSSTFPCGSDFVDLARSTGAFDDVETEALMGGAVHLYRARVIS